jgi:hypothetical protein
MVVGVGFCIIKVDSNFLLVLKIKSTKFHQDQSKTVDLHTKYTNKQTFSFIYMYRFLRQLPPNKILERSFDLYTRLYLDRQLIVLTGMENFHLNAHNFLLSPAFI